MYSIIPNLTQEENKRQTVFCAIYTISQPYISYNQIPKEKRGIEIPLVLMLVRWDGYIGFPGGNVDAGETLHEAVIRELREEIAYTVSSDQLKPLCSFSTESTNIHCFSHQVSIEELKKIIVGSTEAEHFLSETQGCFATQIAEFENNKGFSQFRKNNFKATAGMELDVLVKQILERKDDE